MFSPHNSLWELIGVFQKCSICDIREGACIQCTKASCFLAFHATCARREKFLTPMKVTHGSEVPILACYCEKRLPVRVYVRPIELLLICSFRKNRWKLERQLSPQKKLTEEDMVILLRDHPGQLVPTPRRIRWNLF